MERDNRPTIDESDLQQDSPAEAESEVEEPTANEPDDVDGPNVPVPGIAPGAAGVFRSGT